MPIKRLDSDGVKRIFENIKSVISKIIKGDGSPNKVWATDEEGNPSWKNVEAVAENVLDTGEAVDANTTKGYLVDALVVKNDRQRWAGCWIAFEDAEGNPTDEPYIHWLVEEDG